MIAFGALPLVGLANTGVWWKLAKAAAKLTIPTPTPEPTPKETKTDPKSKEDIKKEKLDIKKQQRLAVLAETPMREDKSKRKENFEGSRVKCVFCFVFGF